MIQFYFRVLFATLALSIFLTERAHGYSQIFFIFVAYLFSFGINQVFFRADLTAKLHRESRPASDKGNLFFRGEFYQSMADVDLEKSYLINAGDALRVAKRRWITRIFFAVFVGVFVSTPGKLVGTYSGFFHILVAATFLPMESLSHSLLPLGLNIVLVTTFIAFGKDTSAPLLILYGLGSFMTLGLFGLNFTSKTLNQPNVVSTRILSSLKLWVLWAALALILFLILPGENLNDLIKAPLQNLTKDLTQKVGDKIQQAAEQSGALPNFDEVNRQAEGLPAAPEHPTQNPNTDNLKQLRQQFAQNMKRSGHENLNFPKGGKLPEASSQAQGEPQQMSPEEVTKQLDGLKKQMDELSKMPKEQLQAQVEDLKKMDSQLGELEKAVEKSQNTTDSENDENKNKETPEHAQKVGDSIAAQPPAPQPYAQAKSPQNPDASPMGSGKVPSSSDGSKPPTQPPPKFEPPNLDRWWPLIKLLIFASLALFLISMLSPYFQKNDPHRAQADGPSKKDREKNP